MFAQPKTLVALLLLFIVAVVTSTVRANDDNYYDADDFSGYYNRFSVCDDSVVIVEEMSLVCDTPGAYYYGGNKYRQSATCQGGDKGRLYVELRFAEDLEADAYLTVEVRGYGSVEAVVLHSGDSLCGTVKSLDGSTDCPAAGYYQLSEQFYFPNKNDDYSYSFTPRITVGVTSDLNNNKYDLGGANTDLCPGNMFSNWTRGVKRSAADTILSFFVTFGILFGAIAAVGFAYWYIRRQVNKKPTPIIVEEQADGDDEEDEYQQLSPMIMANQQHLSPIS
jgi:hypothetical protein